LYVESLESGKQTSESTEARHLGVVSLLLILILACERSEEESDTTGYRWASENAMQKKTCATHARLLNRLLAAAWQTRKSSGARRFQGQARRLTRLWAQGELESKSTLRPCFPRNQNTGKGATQ
jgi:hypothetical protein